MLATRLNADITRLNAVGFDITRWVTQKNTAVLVNKALIIAYKATNNYCTLEKQTESN